MLGMSLEAMKNNAKSTIQQEEECLRLRAEICPSCPFYGVDENGLPHIQCQCCEKVGIMPGVSAVIDADRILECTDKYERFTVDELVAISGFKCFELTKTEFRQNPAIRAIKKKYELSWSEITSFAFQHTEDPRSRLFHFRKKAGLSQKQLAELTGLTYSRISDYERGITKIGNMTISNARKIAAALHCTIEELLDRDEKKI